MFEHENGVDQTIELAKCAACGREMTKDELIRENSENISEHVQEIGKEIIKDLAHDFRKSLKKALQSSKHIRIK